jgi:hypothetical protein
MTTYTHAASRQRFRHLRAHLPAYLVGVGATAALTAGALVVFLSLATFVAFNGLPFGGSSDDVGSAYLDPGPSVAPAAAATALGGAPGAVTNDVAAGGTRAARSAAAAAADAGGSGGGPSGAPSGKGRTGPGASSSPGEIAPPIAVPSTSGPVGGVVQVVDNAAGTNLSGPAGGAAGAVDGAASQAGGAGRAGLGGGAGRAVNSVRGRVLGGAGPAGSLLGR